MILFYHLFLQFYRFFIGIAARWNSKAQKWIQGRENWQQSLAENWQPKKGEVIVWMHCASLGEFEQGRPVLEKMKSQIPNLKVLLTFFSPSGYEVRKNYEGADWVMYLPFDSGINAKHFVEMVRPGLVIFVKYEFWHFYLQELRKRNIPVVLISGIFRFSQPFFRWWGSFHRNMLGCFTHLFVQNDASRKLLSTIGFAERTTVAGDTRFDRVTQLAQTINPVAAVDAFFDGRKLLVAGSTWKEDEDLIAGWFSKNTEEWQLIIAPHEIKEETIQRLLQLFPDAITYSQLLNESKVHKQWHTLIINNVGLLSRLYNYGTVCYVGGGFNKSGHHNILEAAVYGKPIITGPVFKKFNESVELKKLGGSFIVETEDQFQKIIETTDAERAGSIAKEYVKSKSGATGLILQWLQENLLFTNP